MSELRPTPGTPVPSKEQGRAEMNEWIAWLQEWVDNPPAYRAEGPLETTRGLRRLISFLRSVSYDWPVR